MKVLFVWELGNNYGHLMRDLPLALKLRESGCEVEFLVRDTLIADKVIGQYDFDYKTIPISVESNTRKIPISYADILESIGFDSSDALIYKVNSYIKAFDSIKPYAVIGDYAPIAALACKVMDIQFFAIGSGFEIPPFVHPLPSIRPWGEKDYRELKIHSDRVFAVINSVLRHYNKQYISVISDIYGKETSILTTYPELDHYPNRKIANYVGNISSSGNRVDLTHTNFKPTIFSYLNPEGFNIRPVYNALANQKQKAIVVCPGYHHQYALPKHVLHYNDLVPIKDYHSSLKVMISNGNSGTVTQGLLYGIPQIMLPDTLEQNMVAQRVLEMGAGILLKGPVIQSDVLAALSNINNNSAYVESAKEFARNHSNDSILKFGYDPNIINKIAENILSSGLRNRVTKKYLS